MLVASNKMIKTLLRHTNPSCLMDIFGLWWSKQKFNALQIRLNWNWSHRKIRKQPNYWTCSQRIFMVILNRTKHQYHVKKSTKNLNISEIFLTIRFIYCERFLFWRVMALEMHKGWCKFAQFIGIFLSYYFAIFFLSRFRSPFFCFASPKNMCSLLAHIHLIYI